jgi:hypothetical protein
MSTLRIRVLTWAAGLCLVLGLVVAPTLAQTQSTSPTDQSTSSTSTSKKKKVQEGYDQHGRSIRRFEYQYFFQQEIHEERGVGCGDRL